VVANKPGLSELLGHNGKSSTVMHGSTKGSHHLNKSHTNVRNKPKERLLVVTSLLCGSLAAGVFWSNYHPQPSKHLPDDQTAKKMGYYSTRDLERNEAAQKKYLTDATKLGFLDKSDCDYIANTLARGSSSAKHVLCVNLGNISSPDLQRRVLAILGNQRITQEYHAAWSFTFNKWAKMRRGAQILPSLLNSQNPDVASIARELKHA